MVKDDFSLMIMSPLIENSKLEEIKKEYVELFKTKKLPSGWEDAGNLEDIIYKCKWVFAYIFKDITPFDTNPSVAIFEIGEHTNFKVVEPPMELYTFILDGKTEEENS